jgi:hypothetical protein
MIAAAAEASDASNRAPLVRMLAKAIEARVCIERGFVD